MAVANNAILVVEDSDKKFEAIRECIVEACSSCRVERASTMTEAERRIISEQWSLVVLDISLDIAPSIQGAKGRGQANVGGLGIAQKMFLLDRESPTIIVTAFDSFTASNAGNGGNEILGFEEVCARAKEYLPSSLIGCLQYNATNWKQEMVRSVKKVLAE